MKIAAILVIIRKYVPRPSFSTLSLARLKVDHILLNNKRLRCIMRLLLFAAVSQQQHVTCINTSEPRSKTAKGLYIQRGVHAMT